jgi:hypothetical protein
MALDARTRASIYDKLRPILGDDDANALMSEFPAAEHDELVTKEFLRAELHRQSGQLRTELHLEVGGLRAEMHEQIGQLRTEMHEQHRSLAAELRAELVSKDYLETRLAEFRADMAAANSQIMDRLRQQTVFIVTALFGAVGASVGIVQALR